jgi:hypothetical protein
MRDARSRPSLLSGDGSFVALDDAKLALRRRRVSSSTYSGGKADIPVSTQRATFGPMQRIIIRLLVIVLQGYCPILPVFSLAHEASTERLVRRVVFVLLALTTAAHAQAVIFTFDQWERLSAGLQEIYISGALDAVFTISTPAQAATAKFYNDCVVKNQIKAHDIVEEMKVVVRSRPELYPKPATGVLLRALIKLCGTPIPE